MDSILRISKFKLILIWLMSFKRIMCYEIKNGNSIPAIAYFDERFKIHDCLYPDELGFQVTSSVVTYLLPRHLDVRLRMMTNEASGFPSWLASHLPSESHSAHSRSTQQQARYRSLEGDLHISFKCSKKSKNQYSLDFVGIFLYHSYAFLVRPKSTHTNLRHGSFPVVIYELHNGIKPRENTLFLSSIPSSVTITPQRRRRAILDAIEVMTFTIDVLVVVDYSVYNKWQTRYSDTSEVERSQKVKAEIMRYYRYVVDGIDSRYRNIDFGDFSIRIQLADIVIIDEQFILSTNETNNKVNADEALKVFRNWTNETLDLPNYDHALLFVGYDLYTNVTEDNRTVTHTSGLAYIGTMCQPGNSVSIVEEQGGFQSIGTAAHELGHSLGALHDGELNLCLSENRYIMAASGFGPVPDDKQPNPWQFSNCSIEYFRNFIVTRLAEGEPCLKQSGSSLVHSTPTTDDNDSIDVQPLGQLAPPGQHYNPDEQCRLIWGPNSYLCRGAEFGNPTSLCTAMYCRDPDTVNDCVLHTAAAGTSCGNKKWCVSGECTYDERAPIKSDTCVLGDQPGKAFNGLTCAELVEQRPSYCYQEKVRARCCLSCDMKKSSRKGCEYGDRTQGCQPWHCGHAGQMKTIQKDCCSTCSSEEIPISTSTISTRSDDSVDNVTRSAMTTGCHDNGVINGLTCQSYVKQYGVFICYDRRAREMHCCATCAKVRSFKPGCEYGDRTPYLCAKIANLTTVHCSSYGHQCCNTCHTEPEPISGSRNYCSNNFVIFAVFTLFYLLELIEMNTFR